MTRPDARRATLGRRYRERQLRARLHQISRRKPARVRLGHVRVTIDTRPLQTSFTQLAFAFGEAGRSIQRNRSLARSQFTLAR